MEGNGSGLRTGESVGAKDVPTKIKGQTRRVRKSPCGPVCQERERERQDKQGEREAEDQ